MSIRSSARRDDGAQALELALGLPIVLLLLTLLLAAAQLALGLLGTHQAAVLAARLAATRGDGAVLAHLADADPPVEVALDPPSGVRRPGDLVTATASRTVAVLWLPAAGLDVSAEATALVEQADAPGAVP